MNTVTPTVRALAQKLLLHAARMGVETRELEPKIAWDVIEKFRVYLTKLLGVAGYHSVLSRALVLSNKDSAHTLRVRTDGALQGLEELPAGHTTLDALEKLLAHLLGLLIAFIGSELTLQLVRDVWPDLPLDNMNLN